MNLSTVEREEVATELKRFASDLNLTDDQKQKLDVALTEAREKIAEYLQQNPNTTKADVISKVVANRVARFNGPCTLQPESFSDHLRSVSHSSSSGNNRSGPGGMRGTNDPRRFWMIPRIIHSGGCSRIP